MMRSGRLDGIIPLFLWASLLAPLGVLLHELGHFLTARALGFANASIGAAGVSGGARIGEAPDGMVVLQAGAGPLVTLLLLAIALQQVARRRPDWAVALAATAPLRFAVDGVFVGFRLVYWLRGEAAGTPDFDEYNVALAIGVPPLMLALPATLVLLGTWIWLWRRIPRGKRLASMAAVAAGTTAGLLLWILIAGPPLTGVIDRL